MALVRNISNALRINSAYRSPMSWARLLSSTPAPSSQSEVSKPKPDSGSHTMGSRATYKPSDIEKKFLVWTGKYKSVDEVPEYVHQEAMERARHRLRIKGANIMILLTIFGCIYAVYSGKKAAESGESVEKLNIDWHKKYNEGKAK